MEKERYERTKLDISGFRAEDVITTSADEYEGWNTTGHGTSGGLGRSDEYEGWNPLFPNGL